MQGCLRVTDGEILAVFRALWSDTSEAWWEVWSFNPPCFPLNVNLLPLAGVRGHCVEIRTRWLKHHDIRQASSETTRTSSLLYNQEFFSVDFFFCFFFPFLPCLFSSWERCATACVSCVQAGSEQAERQVPEGSLVFLRLCYNRRYIQSWLRL